MSILFNYQNFVEKTAKVDSEKHPDYYYLGLAGEAGEVSNERKKAIRDDGDQLLDARKSRIVLELGDTLWYLTKVANDLGYSLEDVMRLNMIKLETRQQKGRNVG